MILHDRSRQWRTREEFAHATGLSARTLDDLEAGRRDNYLDATLAAVEVTLGWQVGSCLRVVGGGKVRREMDPSLARIMAVWPTLSDDARAMLADVAERARSQR